MRRIALYDVSVAFYHALLNELIWVDPPKGEEEDSSIVWQLRKALYGTRRAALLFQEYVISTMKTLASLRSRLQHKHFTTRNGGC